MSLPLSPQAQDAVDRLDAARRARRRAALDQALAERADQLLQDVMRRAGILREPRVTVADRVLQILPDRDDAMSIDELTEATGATRSSVSSALQRLRRSGDADRFWRAGGGVRTGLWHRTGPGGPA